MITSWCIYSYFWKILIAELYNSLKILITLFINYLVYTTTSECHYVYLSITCICNLFCWYTMYTERIYYIGCACFQILIELNAYWIYSIKMFKSTVNFTEYISFSDIPTHWQWRQTPTVLIPWTQHEVHRFLCVVYGFFPTIFWRIV